MTAPRTESEILAAVLARIGSRPDVRLWRANTGVGVTPDGRRVVRFGIKGAADLSGIVRGGRRLEIEVKTARGRQSPAQAAFQRMIETFGGIYLLARSVDEAEEQLERALGKAGA